MAKKPTARTSGKAATQNLVVWVRLPMGGSIKFPGPKVPELTKLLKDGGLNPDAKCYGGNACVA